MTSNVILTASAACCFCSFGWGMVCHFRRLGKPSRAMILTGLAATGFAIVNLFALGLRPCRFMLPAVALYASSAVLFWWSVRVTRQKLAACGQGSVSKEVVSDGPYRFIRHPFYTSYNLAWIAGFLATGWCLLAFVALLMALLYDRFATEEERGLLLSGLGASYERYRSRTGKYLPWVTQCR
jgi:protein-S-isoprenylcysteine O-methyltransferase Ste14